MNRQEEGVLEEVGCVVAAGPPGRATVRIARSEECAGCHGCSFMDAEGGMVTEVEDPLGVRPGYTVRIRTTGVEGKVKAALLLFGMPLAMLLAGAIVTDRLLRGLGLGAALEALSVLGGLLLVAAYFGVLFLVRRSRSRGKGSVRSRIVEILDRSPVASA